MSRRSMIIVGAFAVLGLATLSSALYSVSGWYFATRAW